MESALGLSHQLGGNISKIMQVNMSGFDLDWGALACGAVPLLDGSSLVDEVLESTFGLLYGETASAYEAETAATTAETDGVNSAACIENSRLPVNSILNELDTSVYCDAHRLETNADGVATFCGGVLYEDAGLNSQIGEFFESSAVKTSVAAGFNRLVKSGHDSGVSSCDGGLWLMQPACESSQIASISAFVTPSELVSGEYPSTADFTCESRSPSGGSVMLTDEEEEILADLDLLMTDNFVADKFVAAGDESADDDVTNELNDEVSVVSQWLSKSNGSSLAAAGSSHGASDTGANIQAPPTGRRRGRKRCISPSSRRERKRQQNREAAQRYRNRKHGEVDDLDVQVNSMEERNRELRDELRRTTTELNVLRRFADRFDLRGLFREKIASHSTSSTSSKLNMSLAALEKLMEHDKVPRASAGSSHVTSTKVVTIVHATAKSAGLTTTDGTRKRRELLVSQTPCKLARR